MIAINNALRKLNTLNSKENKNKIDKLINLMKNNQKINKFFNSKTTFAFSILFDIFASMKSDKTIEFFSKVLSMMHLNNTRAITVDDV